MATIGLDKLFYSKITEDANGSETYGTPSVLAKAMTAGITVELNEAALYADDRQAEIVKEFKSGTLSLGVDDIGTQAAADLTGTVIDANGVVVSTSEDSGEPVLVVNHDRIEQQKLEVANVDMISDSNKVMRLNASMLASFQLVKTINDLYSKSINLQS